MLKRLVLIVFICTAATAHAADFDTLHQQFTKITGELQSLRGKFQTTSDPADQQRIVKQYNDLITQVQALMPKLSDAAIEAYKAAPNKDPKLRQFMTTVVGDLITRDRYERARDVAALMIENNHPDPHVYEAAGMAAFALHDFDAAEKHFNTAKQAGHNHGPVEQFAPAIDAYKQHWQREQKLRAEEAKADDLPRVKMQTTEGTMIIELYENQAPNTVANFISLVENGFYDGVPFHRVIGNFMAQGGDPTGTGGGGPGYTIKCECYRDDARMHFRGTLSMAHAGRDTGGSQFFLTFLPTPHLNGKHTAFGRVIEGLDVMAKLNRVDPRSGAEPSKMTEVTVLRKRDHAYEPTTQAK